MDNRDLRLKISLACVKEHLACPICIGILTETHITHCGHRFCKDCILECINRKPICPCCNAHLRPDMVLKDPLFDNLVESVKTEESEAERKYFDEIINSVTENAKSMFTNYQELRQFFSPVEEVLKDHLRKSLSMHEKFYQDLQRDLVRQHLEIDSDFKFQVEMLREKKGNAFTVDVENLRMEAEEKKNKFTAETQKCSALVAEAYDRYLSDHIPPLSILPVSVTVSLLRKGLQFNGVQLKPRDSVDDIKQKISELVKLKHGDDVISFDNDVRFLCISPLARQSLFETLRMSADVIEHGATSPDVILLPSDCRPVLQYSIKPGSEIAVHGLIRCESDLPKACFASTFQADGNASMDYFKCKNCNLNWICRPCCDFCHKDHDVVLYIEKHQPTWGCCYCARKKKCEIRT